MKAEEYLDKYLLGGKEDQRSLMVAYMNRYAAHLTEEKDKEIERLKEEIRLKTNHKVLQEISTRAKDQLLKEMAEALESFDPSILDDKEKYTLSKYKEMIK